MSSDLTKNPPQNNLAYLLMTGFRWIEQRVKTHLADESANQITMMHMAIFGALAPEGSTIAELARGLGVSRQAMHQAVHELMRLSLLDLEENAADKRSRLVRLTAKGRALDRRAVAYVHTLERELAGRIGAQKVAALRDALEADWNAD